MQSIDISCDKTIKRNDIKKVNNLCFKTIDDPEVIERLMVGRNTHILNSAEGFPITVDPMASLIGKDSFTSFSEKNLIELLTCPN